jgi:hypothetical protein
MKNKQDGPKIAFSNNRMHMLQSMRGPEWDQYILKRIFGGKHKRILILSLDSMLLETVTSCQWLCGRLQKAFFGIFHAC